jgi:hypothetical protein
VLEIANAPHAASRLDDDEKSTIAINDSGNLNDLRTIISESGLYSLVLTSRKPEAKVFKRWVTGMVLPTIRKTGTYTVPTALPAPEGAGAWAEAVFDMGFHRTPTGKSRPRCHFASRRSATRSTLRSRCLFPAWEEGYAVRSRARRISKQNAFLRYQVIPMT